MQTILGLLTALIGIAIVVTPWAPARAAGGPLTVVLEAIGAAVALVGLALSHRMFRIPRSRDPRH
jgi:hypothetical protein